jgi:hypothetical protein
VSAQRKTAGANLMAAARKAASHEYVTVYDALVVLYLCLSSWYAIVLFVSE